MNNYYSGVPTDPYADYDPSLPGDERVRRQQAIQNMPGPEAPPPVPSNVPDVPPVAAVPPPVPEATSQLSSGPAADPASQTMAETKAQTPTSAMAQQTPAEGTPAPPPPPGRATEEGPGPDPSMGASQAPPNAGRQPMVTGDATRRAMDYANKILVDPKTGEFKKPSMLQNIGGAMLSMYPNLRHIDVHPGLTRQYQNYGLLAQNAQLERQGQVAQATEAEKYAAIDAHRASARAAKTIQRDPYKDLMQDNGQGGYTTLMPGTTKTAGNLEADITRLRESNDPDKEAKIAQLKRDKNDLSSGGDVGPLSEEQKAMLRVEAADNPSLDVDAWTYLLTKNHQLNVRGGLGRSSAPQVKKIKDRASQMMKDMGLDVADVMERGATLQASLPTLAKLSQTNAVTQQFEGTLLRNAELARTLSEQFNRGDVQLLNRIIGAIKTGTGDEEALNLAGQLHTMAMEWAKIMAGNTSVTGVPISEANAVQQMLEKGLSKGQLGSFIDKVIKPDAANRIAANEEVLGKLMGKVRGTTQAKPGGPPAATPQAAPAPTAPAAPAAAPAPAVADAAHPDQIHDGFNYTWDGVKRVYKRQGRI